MQPFARLGDKHICPMHGTNVITGTATRSTCDARPIATIGDVTTCGAVIVTGSAAVTVDGRPAATLGSKTSHGGVIISDSRSLG